MLEVNLFYDNGFVEKTSPAEFMFTSFNFVEKDLKLRVDEIKLSQDFYIKLFNSLLEYPNSYYQTFPEESFMDAMLLGADVILDDRDVEAITLICDD